MLSITNTYSKKKVIILYLLVTVTKGNRVFQSTLQLIKIARDQINYSKEKTLVKFSLYSYTVTATIQWEDCHTSLPIIDNPHCGMAFGRLVVELLEPCSILTLRDI